VNAKNVGTSGRLRGRKALIADGDAGLGREITQLGDFGSGRKTFEISHGASLPQRSTHAEQPDILGGPRSSRTRQALPADDSQL